MVIRSHQAGHLQWDGDPTTSYKIICPLHHYVYIHACVHVRVHAFYTTHWYCTLKDVHTTLHIWMYTLIHIQHAYYYTCTYTQRHTTNTWTHKSPPYYIHTHSHYRGRRIKELKEIRHLHILQPIQTQLLAVMNITHSHTLKHTGTHTHTKQGASWRSAYQTRWDATEGH